MLTLPSHYGKSVVFPCVRLRVVALALPEQSTFSMWNCSKVLHRQFGPGLFAVKRESISFPRGSLMRFRQQSFPQAAMCVKWMWWRLRTSCLCKRQNARRQHSANKSEQERIRIEIVSNFHADAALHYGKSVVFPCVRLRVVALATTRAIHIFTVELL